MKETKSVALTVESNYKDAFNEFEETREDTNDTFKSYGKLKLEILDGSMKDFVDTFKQIKNVEFQDQAVTNELVRHSEVDEMVLAIEKQVVQAGQIMTAGLASLAGGALAALGAVGATTTFATASTGTAIAALSGVAAKNATLAFLGGGSGFAQSWLRRSNKLNERKGFTYLHIILEGFKKKEGENIGMEFNNIFPIGDIRLCFGTDLYKGRDQQFL